MNTKIAWVWVAGSVLIGACGDRVNFGSNDVDAGTERKPSATGAGGGSATGGSEPSATGGSGGTAVQGDVAGVGTGGGSSLSPSAPWDGGVTANLNVPATPFPRRVVFFYTPHGTVLDAWRPSGQGASFALSPILKPLEPFRSQLTIVEGLSNSAVANVPAKTHESAPSVLLTAHLGKARGSAGSYGYFAGAPSFAFVTPSGAVQFPAVLWGVQTPSSVTDPVFIDYGAPEEPAIPNNSPARVAQLLFGNFTGSGGPPATPSGLDLEANDSYPVIAQAQLDSVIGALSYGLTNKGSISFGTVASTTRFTWLGADMTEGYTALAEASASEPARSQYIRIQTWYAEQFAYLIGQLAKLPEGNETLLDHTAVVWISDTGEASSHSGAAIPVVIAGGLGAYLRTGQYVRFEGRSQADLLVTLARAMGRSDFGDPAFGAHSLEGLLR